MARSGVRAVLQVMRRRAEQGWMNAVVSRFMGWKERAGRRLQRTAVHALVFAVLPLSAAAQTVRPDAEYDRYVHTAPSSISPTEFGESVDLRDGLLSIRHTDLERTGIGPTIRILRTFRPHIHGRTPEASGRDNAIGKPAMGQVAFMGHQMDGPTGLILMQQRYQVPDTGRFLSVDPVNVDTKTGNNFNRYWYANNNPYKFTDPDGRQERAYGAGASLGLTPEQRRIWEAGERAATTQGTGAVQGAAMMDGIKAFAANPHLSKEAVGKLAVAIAVGKITHGKGGSPILKAADLSGKTRSEIKAMAACKGLCAAGDKNHPDYPRKWNDPVTGRERLRLDRGHMDPNTGKPFNNPNAAADHVHGYDSNGVPIRDPASNDKHFPTRGD